MDNSHFSGMINDFKQGIFGALNDKKEELVRAGRKVYNPVSYTHLDVYKRQGKTVIPFATSSSSGMGERTGTVIIDNRIFRDAGRVSCLFMCQKVFLNGTLILI